MLETAGQPGRKSRSGMEVESSVVQEFERFIRSNVNSLEILKYNLKGELTVVISNKFNVKKKEFKSTKRIS